MNAPPTMERGRRPFLPEPAPVGALARLACYPWLVVGVACLGPFAGQVDASIVQLGLPKLCVRPVAQRRKLGGGRL